MQKLYNEAYEDGYNDAKKDILQLIKIKIKELELAKVAYTSTQIRTEFDATIYMLGWISVKINDHQHE